MILPDVNVLVHAFRRESPRHEVYRDWLHQAVTDRAGLALAEPVLTGFVRVVTNPRVFAVPAPTPLAVQLVATLLSAAGSSTVHGSAGAWRTLGDWAGEDRRLRGNLVPDAWLASLATQHGCRIATADRGFARFPGVRFFDPGDD